MLPYDRWAPFLTNHDQDRVMTTLGNDVSKAKIAAVALLTLPGMPFVYYGEEIGMIGQKPDERIRTPMQWTSDGSTGGFTTVKPWEPLQKNTAEVNVAAQDGDPGSLLNLYRKLINLHTTTKALSMGALVPIKTSDGAVAAFLRAATDETILVVLNFSKVAAEGVTLDLNGSQLAPGIYKLAPLLGDQAGAQLTVGASGNINGYAPVPSLAPHTGYIFKLTN
jgi:glycosidase